MTDLKTLLGDCSKTIGQMMESFDIGEDSDGGRDAITLLTRLDSAIAGMKVVEVRIVEYKDCDNARLEVPIAPFYTLVTRDGDSLDILNLARSLDGKVLKYEEKL